MVSPLLKSTNVVRVRVTAKLYLQPNSLKLVVPSTVETAVICTFHLLVEFQELRGFHYERPINSATRGAISLRLVNVTVS